MSGKGRARTFGAVSIVNAIASGKGASLGVALPSEASVEVNPTGHLVVETRGARGVPTALARATAIRTLEWAGMGSMGAWITVESGIPMSRGLKSSSAVSNAIVIATLEAVGRLDGVTEDQILRLGVEASKQAGVSITGAYDDACATLLGGLCITDNARLQLVKRVEVHGLHAVIHVPEEQIAKSRVAAIDHTGIEQQVLKAWELALAGEHALAMRQNGELYARLYGLSEAPAEAMMKAGALAAGLSGTGPSTAALCRPEEVAVVADAARAFAGSVLTAPVNNGPGGVIRRSS